MNSRIKTKSGWRVVSFVLLIFLLSVSIPAHALERIPKIIFSRLDGKFFSSADLIGKVTLLNFWATWHPPCRSEIPGFIKLYDKYREKKFEIIGISLDKDKKNLKKFVENVKINYPIIISNKGIEQAFGGIETIPMTFLADKKGKIRFRFVGYTRKEVFEEKIKLLLRE